MSVRIVSFVALIVAFAQTSAFAQPTITSISPTSGNAGVSVTITGTNFSATAGNNTVFFGATKATVTAASTTSLAVTVPSGATFGPISVQVANLTAISTQFFLPTFTAVTPGIGSNSLVAKVDFTTGTGPIGVAIGDLDGDGKPDLAVANQGSSTVSVYRSTSTSGVINASSFAAKVDFTTGTLPQSVAIRDVDGDGKPDLALANYGSNTLSVYRNTSTSGVINASSFAAKVDFTTGTNPRGVVIGDVDGDGKPDLTVANEGSNTVSIFRNTSAPGTIDASSFAAKVDFTTGALPRSVAMGDVDGDGKPDLALANWRGGSGTTVSVYRNTSTSGVINASSFAAKVDFTTGSGPISVAIGDVDGDGKLDLAVANNGSATVSVFRNTSASGVINASSLSAKVDFTTGSGPFGVSVGDVDGDGKPDLAVTNDGSATVSMFRNTATSGTINASSFATKADFTTGTNPYSVVIGDVDGDGKPDLTVANNTSNTVSVLRNLDPLFLEVGASAGVDDAGTGEGAAWGDYDGDGDQDLYVVNYGSANKLYRNNGNGTFTEVGVSAGVADTGNGNGAAWGDYDNDGDLDLYLTNNGTNRLYRNNGNGTFTEVGAAAGVANVGYGIGTAWGDYDNDGDLDLYVVNYGSANLLYRNNGNGTFTEVGVAASVNNAGTGYAAAWGDYDNDGDLDLYLANNGTANRLYRNNGNGTFTEVGAAAGVADAGSGFGVAWGDYDNDGRLDLYLTNFGQPNRLYRNNGNGTFTEVGAAAGVDDGGNGVGTAWGDYDGDGDLDLYMVNQGTNRLYRNNGNSNRWLHVKLVLKQAHL